MIFILKLILEGVEKDGFHLIFKFSNFLIFKLSFTNQQSCRKTLFFKVVVYFPKKCVLLQSILEKFCEAIKC